MATDASARVTKKWLVRLVNKLHAAFSTLIFYIKMVSVKKDGDEVARIVRASRSVKNMLGNK
jgi:hypothetical protein